MAANPTSVVVASSDGSGGTGHLQVSPNRGKLRAFNATGEGSVEATPALSALTTTATDGTQGVVQATPTLSYISTTGLDGKQGVSQVSPIRATMATYSGNGLESGWIRAQATDAELASVSPSNVYTSRLRATTSEASMFSSAGGTNRYLTVDATGVWVKTGGKSYNLEQTATMPAPQYLPYEFDASWDSASSPMGSVLVTHSATGRACQSRVRFNRRGSNFTVTTTNTTIGRVIPTAARTTFSMVDYIPVTLPGGVAGEVVTDYQFGHVYLKTLTGTATMAPGDYVYATLQWFLPN